MPAGEIDNVEANYRLIRDKFNQLHTKILTARETAKGLRLKAEAQIAHASALEAYVAKEELRLQKIEFQLNGLREEYHEELIKLRTPPTQDARKICMKPCGKIRFDSREAARDANKKNQHRLRVYYDSKCGCYHITKNLSRSW